MIVIQKKGSPATTFHIDWDSGMLVEDSPTSTTSFTLEPLTGELGYTSDIQFLIDGYGYLRVNSTNVRAIANSLTYNGTFMQLPFLSIEVKSSHRVDFEIGDYITWEYDGLVYELNDIPKEDKKAKEGSYGEAFVYELRFESVFAKMKNCSMLDVVPNENNEHFTALPNFSFFGNANALADRINSNLTRLYDNIVVSIDTSDPEISAALSEEMNIDIANINCLDAMRIFYDNWKVGYVFYYNESTLKYTARVGALGGSTTSFSYGKGNGLYLVAKTEDSSNVVTRVRAYGSDENLPARFYNNLTDTYGNPLIGEMQYIPNLMIPVSKWGTSLGMPDVLKAYIDANNPDVDVADTSMAEFGIREKSLFFDGTDGRKDIKPTIKGLTAGMLRASIASYTGEEVYYSPSATYPYSERLDKIRVGDSTSDDGIVLAKEYYEESVDVTGFSDTEPLVAKNVVIPLGFTNSVTLINDGKYTLQPTSVTVSATNENLIISFMSLDVYLNRNGNRMAKVASYDGTDITNGMQCIASNVALEIPEGGDSYNLELILNVTMSDIDYGVEEDLAYTLGDGSFKFVFNKKFPNDQFTIGIKQIGFDINKFVAESGDEPIIHMTSGACAGREFIIKATEYDGVNDAWVLTCKRQTDGSIEQMFPNQYFHIAEGDTFVLLHISMPTIFVEAASLELYNAACDWLRVNKTPRYTIEPSIDEIYMAHNPQVIKEGMLMPLVDTDLGIDESIIINSVTINETGDKLRDFNVVLRQDVEEDLSSYLAKNNQRQTVRTLTYIVNAHTTKTQSTQNLAVYAAEAPASTTTTTVSGNYHPYGGGKIDFIADTLRSFTFVVPKQVPAEGTLDTGEWALYIADTGFGGETPPATGDMSLGELNDVTFGTLINNQAPVYNSSLGYFTNQTVSLDGHNHNSIYYTKIEVDALVGSGDYHPLYGLDGGITPLDLNADKLIMKTLVLPTTAPSLVSGEWALYIADTGFGGETPASPTINTLSDIPDTSLTSAIEGDIIIRDGLGQWINIPFAHNHNSIYYTKTETDSLLSSVSIDAYTTSEIDDFFSGVTAMSGYNRDNWNTAYSWGNHASQGYLTSLPPHNHNTLYYTKTEIDNAGYLTSLPSHNHDNRYFTESEINNFFSGVTAISGYNRVNWNTAYGWGNHASQGYLTSLPSHNHDDRYFTETEITTNYYNKTYHDNYLKIPTSAPTNPESGAWYLYIV